MRGAVNSSKKNGNLRNNNYGLLFGLLSSRICLGLRMALNSNLTKS